MKKSEKIFNRIIPVVYIVSLCIIIMVLFLACSINVCAKEEIMPYREQLSTEKIIEKIVESARRNMQKELDVIESIEDNMEWFAAYKEIRNKYPLADVPENVYDYYTWDEIYLMCRVVETECYDRDFDSKCNVANVIFNRIDSGLFGETVEDIVTTPKQFAYGREKITTSSLLAVEYAFEICDNTLGSVYFEGEGSNVHSSYAEYVFTDDAKHKFYKLKEEEWPIS